MKESQKRALANMKHGFIMLLKIIWIVLKSFGEAITWDFYHNVRKYWKKTFKEASKPAAKSAQQTPLP